MRIAKGKADLLGVLDKLTVEQLDDELRTLGRKWMRTYLNRQLLASEEGITTPPPEPPRVEKESAPSVPAVAESGLATELKSANPPACDTIRNLVRVYMTAEGSPYHSLRHITRRSYDGHLRRIVDECGDWKLSDIKAQNFNRLHSGWSAGGTKITIAHNLIAMMRTLFGFGTTVLEDSECERLSVVLSKMRFKMSKPRSERLTDAQVNDIRAAAHARDLHSMALAQALQYEGLLRQKDVIGEWVPASSGDGNSEFKFGKFIWVGGLRWSQIDDKLVLRYVGGKGRQNKILNLADCPMIVEELEFFKHKIGSNDPVVLYEKTGDPYLSHQFRREWRTCARAANVPDNILNMDSRSAGKRSTDGGEDTGGDGHQDLGADEIRKAQPASSSHH